MGQHARRVHRTNPTVEVALDGRIAAGNRTLVSDVALSLSDWDVSSGPYACLSQMRSLGRDLAKTTAKLVEHPELVADRIITFTGIVGQENVIAGTDRGLVTLRMRFREPGLACAQISISIDDRFELLNDRLAEGIHYKRFRRKSFFLMVFSVCLMPRLLVAG